MGTPGYIAPEIVAGAEATPASDQWAIAATGIELLTGVRLKFDRPGHAAEDARRGGRLDRLDGRLGRPRDLRPLAREGDGASTRTTAGSRSSRSGAPSTGARAGGSRATAT